MKNFITILLMVLTMANLINGQEELRKQAEQLSKELIIIDTHIDLPGLLQNKWEDISKTASGDFDYPRAKAGGLDVAFMSV